MYGAFMNADIKAAHKHSSKHRAEVMRSTVCGCFHCLATFNPSEIWEWIDWPAGTPSDQLNDAGTTAMCPRCGIDSVLGSASGYPITAEFLKEMQRYWFES